LSNEPNFLKTFIDTKKKTGEDLLSFNRSMGSTEWRKFLRKLDPKSFFIFCA
jgi:hypothetical protein